MRMKVMTALTLALLANAAHADDYLSPTEERVRLSLGVVHTSNQTDLQIDSSAGVAGTPISGEDQFGLNESDFEPKFQAMVRVQERHRLRFDYFTLDRDGSTTVAQPIIFRDVVLQPGDPLNSNLSLTALSITYEYSFLHAEKYEVAATIGVTDTDLSARARVSTPTRHVNQTEDQAGPFPTAGIDATWVISKRFYLDGRAEYMHLSYNNLDGSLGFFEFDALYRLRPNIAFALGYNVVRANLESSQSSQSGYFDLTTKGPEFFVRVAF
jgi:opacity protein-like surface antigen